LKHVLFFACSNHFNKNETNKESEKGKQKIGGRGKKALENNNNKSSHAK